MFAPGPMPQSGTIAIPARLAAARRASSLRTIAVFPPRSTMDALAATVHVASGRLDRDGTAPTKTAIPRGAWRAESLFVTPPWPAWGGDPPLRRFTRLAAELARDESTS